MTHDIIHTPISAEELALQRKRFSHLSDDEFRFMIQQVDGRQRTRDKLPTFSNIDDWWYPVRISCEQCSSEATAKYKASLLPSTHYTLVDLTGGYGVDTFFMSKNASIAHYVERNEELCKIVAHNFSKYCSNIHIHNTDAINYLQNMQLVDIIYIDPARRNQHGGKVFRLEECEPNVIELLPILRSKSKQIIIKLSPMLDITQAIQALDGNWDVHVVALKNEVKEILLVSCIDRYHPDTTLNENHKHTDGMVYAINLSSNISAEHINSFIFSRREELNTQIQLYNSSQQHILTIGSYIYEPNAAIIKAGAYKLVAKRYELFKLSQNTHLYISDKLIQDFPGRIWRIISTDIKKQPDIRANIMTRNYPLSPEQLRKKLKVKDSDTQTIIGARIIEKPTLLLAERIN